MRIFAAFVPVDEEHTLLYLRFYQKFMRLPVLGKQWDLPVIEYRRKRAALQTLGE